MKNMKEKLKNQSKVDKSSFTGSNITKYSGLNTVAKYMNRQHIVKSLSTSFPAEWHNAAKFGVNQEGAAKGFNTTKKGAKSYHPLLVFVSEMKLLYHTWFRTGSAYTANGVVEFLKEVHPVCRGLLGKCSSGQTAGSFQGIYLTCWNPFRAHGVILFLGLSGQSETQKPGKFAESSGLDRC